MLSTVDSENTARDLAFSNLVNMSKQQGIDPDEYRAQQLITIKRKTPYLMTVNIAAAALVSWVAWPTAISAIVLAWAGLMLSISLFVVITGWCKSRRRQNHRTGRCKASLRAGRRAEAYAGILGGLWGALPAATFPSAPAEVSFIIMGVVMGACGLGAFALSQFPSSALIYASIVTSSLAGSALALGGRGGVAVAMLGVIYGVALGIMIVKTHYQALRRAKDQRALENQNEIIKLLLREFESGTKDWMWETDVKNNLRYASGRLMQLCGKPHERIIGAKLSEVVCAHSACSEWASIAKLMAERRAIESFDVPIMSNGETTWWQINAEPIYDDQHRFEGYRGVAVDITEMRRVTDELRAAKQAAEQASAAKSQFLAVMSHELRTPLNSIVGYAELACVERHDGSADPDMPEYLCNILDHSRHLSRLINDILDVTRIEKGRMELIEQEVDIDELVEITTKMCQVQARDALIKLSARYEVRGMLVRGDLTRLRQILVNIIANAIKFTAARGEVEVIVGCTEQGEPEIAVRDTGIGIEPTKLEAIFEPFMQAEQSKTRQYEGAGLGLAISRALARLHDGDVTLVSRPGEGTVATLRLPRSRVVKLRNSIVAA